MKLKGPTFPNFRLRSIAWVGDLAIGFILLSYIRSFPKINEFELDIQNVFSDLAGTHAQWITSIILIYLATLCIRFYSILIFSVSPGQKILNIRSQGGVIWKRVAGAARVILSGLLGPLLLDIIPMFMKKKSLSEYITLTTLMCYPTRASIIRTYTLLPLLLFLCLPAPLLENLTIIDGIETSFINIKKEKLANSTDFAKFNHYFSNKFTMSSFSSLKDGRFLLIPSFKIMQKDEKKKIIPYIIFYDLQTNSYGSLLNRKSLNLRTSLLNIEKESYLFNFNYPKIVKLLKEDEKEFSVRDYDQSFRNNKILNQEYSGQLKLLIEDSLSLNLINLLKHIIKRGPFVRGFIHFRKDLIEKVRSENMLNADLVIMGNYEFIRFIKEFDKESTNEGITEILIPQGTLNAKIFEFFWEYNDKSAREDFRETFFSVVDWYFDYKNIFAYPKEKKQMGPLHIVDFYTKGDLTQTQRSSFEDYIYHYFFDLCQKALEQNDDKLQLLLLKTLTRFYMVGQILNQDMRKIDASKSLYSNKFLAFIEGLKLSLREKDHEFFVD